MYPEDVTVAPGAAEGDTVGVLALLLFLGGLVALVGAGLALRLALRLPHVGHHVDELLQRRAQLALLVLLQPEVQSLVDHDAQRLDHLQGHTQPR